MDFEHYKKEAVLTLAKPESPKEYHIDHAVIGINTELGELRENFLNMFQADNVIEECGDICWYGAVFAWAVGDPFGPYFVQRRFSGVRIASRAVDMMHIAAADALDVTKKALYYDKPRDMLVVRNSVEVCMSGVAWLARNYGVDMPKVLLANNTKLLKKRYPGGKFTSEQAINRDPEAERQVFK